MHKDEGSTKRPRRPSRAIRKPLQFNLRMSQELRAELDLLAKHGSRPISCQIEHMITLARMAIEFCNGSDNLGVVEDRLKKAAEVLENR